MSDSQSDHQSQTLSSDLSPERRKPAPQRWVWVFLIIGLVLGLEANIQQFIAGPRTYMLLALVGAAFGRAIDCFQAGRTLRGTGYLFPPAILIILIVGVIIFPAPSSSSRFKLPQVNDPEVTSLVIRSIEHSPEVKAMSKEFGKFTLTEVAEIAFNEEKQERVARAKLNSNLGTEEIFYSVKWHDRENGLIFVQVVDEP